MGRVLPSMSVAAPPAGAAPATIAGSAAPAATERDDVVLLTSAQAGELLSAVLGAEGVDLSAWAVDRVHHRPGVGVTVGYTVRWRAGGRDGEEYLLATTAPLPPTDPSGDPRLGLTTVRAGRREVSVWRHPCDPALPGLAGASDVGVLAPSLGHDPRDVRLELITYRPLRRAVLRASTSTSTAYVKVVRPHTAAGLVERHGLLEAAGLPVPHATSLRPGVVALAGLPGMSLTDALARDGAASLDPSAVVAMLDRFPPALVDLPRRPSWSDRVEHHGDAAAAALPVAADEAASLAAQVRQLLGTCDPGPVVATHGDLHDQNLLVRGAAVVGLLDVDSAGPGYRVDDLACLLAHMSVLPVLDPTVHRHVPAALARWTARFDLGVDPVALRARAAAVTISLVAGARNEDDPQWRDQAHRILAVARTWTEDAWRVRGLSPPHPSRLILRRKPR